jgi:hypothetical protein
MAFFMRDKDSYQPEIKEIDETDKDHTTNMLRYLLSGSTLG